MPDRPQAPERRTIRAAESRIEFLLVGVLTPLVAGTLVYVHLVFAPITPPARLWIWTGITTVTVAVMGGLSLIVWLRRPDDAEVMRIWAPGGKVAAVLFDTSAALSVWLLLPYASEPLRLLMVVFYAAAVTGQVISTAESLGTIVFGVVSIFGSAAAFFLMSPGPYSGPVAFFLLAFGGLMVGVAAALKVAMRTAISARIAAERMSEELAGALAEATEAREAKTRFIAAATHDLRQPLQAASLFLRALTPRRAEEKQAAEHAELAFQEATDLLERLLDHVRLDGGLVEARTALVPIGPVLDRLKTELGPFAETSQVSLHMMADRRTVVADPQLLIRILRNLVHNAIRHANARRILVGARADGDRMDLLVIDDGRGIDLHAAEALFSERKPASAPQAAGVGLGLPSARRMAELMGAELTLDRRWRKGAAFRLRLPRAVRAARPLDVPEPLA